MLKLIKRKTKEMSDRVNHSDKRGQFRPKTTEFYGKDKSDKLKIIVLGGLEEVGRNMTLMEYGNEIIIIDMGLQFPDEDMPGIDYIIPDISYLQGKEKNIRGVVITHGHYDHIGGIPHIMPKIGNPMMYTGRLTAGIIKKREEEYSKILNYPITEIDENSKIALGHFFRLEFFRVNHNIPDSFGVIVHTPIGTVVHTGDFKFDYNPLNEKPIDLTRIAMIGSRGVLALLADSTDAEHPGYQISEAEVTTDLEKIFQEAKGRIFAGTFASLLNRIQQLIILAEKYERKVVIEGRSMQSNIEISHQLGYMKIKPHTIIEKSEMKNLPDQKILILCTGAQGEKRAALKRIANNEDKFLSIKKDDSIIFSSSVIPGNERSIQTLKDTLYRQGAKVYHYKMMDVHAGGHAKQEDLKLMIRLMKPKYFVPIEAYHYMLIIHGELAKSVGVDEKNVFIANNGQVMEFIQERSKINQGQYVTNGFLTKNSVPTEYIMVDGLGVGDVSNIVLRDRQMLAADGMLVVIATIDKRTGALIGSPDIISRGFVYMKGSRKLIEETRSKVKKILVDKNPQSAADDMYLKNKIRDEIGQFLFKKTKRRPMVLPVVIEV